MGAKVDEEEVEGGGDLGGNEGDGVEEGVEEGCDKGTANADLSKQDQAALAELNYFFLVLLNSGWSILLTTKGIS